MDRIAPYVTNLDSNVYCLTGLPEEVIAVLFAYYSRSPGTLRENLAKLLDEEILEVAEVQAAGSRAAGAEQKAAAFHERWVVGYGHSSVAEHAVVHVAVEDVSLQAAKATEDCRLAAYTEKSTRYIRRHRRRIYRPEHCFHLHDAEWQRIYGETVEILLDTYDRLFEALRAQYEQLIPKERFSSSRA